MGTAGIWKLIMMAWSYENNLAIPDTGESRAFTGGLSRLLQVGYIPRVVKLDYNSLYPAITLTWDIKPPVDVTNVMTSLLGYILDQREKYKDMKGAAGKNSKKCKAELEVLNQGSEEYELKLKEINKYDSEANSHDKSQLPLKILANGFFGSFGSSIFNWAQIDAAEKITCIGRQSLRLMTHWFGQRGYKAIVGDSFLYDTPIYIKYKNSDIIDIKSIGEVFNSNESDIDELGREYDLSEKPYQVLCRGGWIDVNYVYRHKTDKQIHRISFNDGYVDVTADHSVFNENKEKLHSKDVIPNETKLEMANLDYSNFIIKQQNLNVETIEKMASVLALSVDINKKVPAEIINTNKENQIIFLNKFMSVTKLNKVSQDNENKVLKAGILFLVNRTKNN